MNQSMRGGEPGSAGRIEITGAGWLLVLCVIGSVGYAGFAALGGRVGAAADRVTAREVNPPVAPRLLQRPAQGADAARAPAGASANVSSDAQRDRQIQTTAWRAVAEANKEQIASIAAGLQELDDRVDALQKVASQATTAVQPASPARAAREGAAQVASASKALHQALDATRATAGVNIAALPIESVAAQALNVTGFTSGGVVMAGRRLAPGQTLQTGEAIIAIDSESHSIVTTRRIINITDLGSQ